MLNRFEMIAKLNSLVKALNPKATLYSFARDRFESDQNALKKKLDLEIQKDLLTNNMIFRLFQRELCTIAESLFEQQLSTNIGQLNLKSKEEPCQIFIQHLKVTLPNILEQSYKILLETFESECKKEVEQNSKKEMELHQAPPSLNIHLLFPKKHIEITFSILKQHLDTISNTIITRFHLIYQLYISSKKNQCTYLQHFNQNEDPLFYALSHQYHGICFGVVYSSAIALRTSSLTKPSQITSELQKLLNFLDQLPQMPGNSISAKFPIFYTLCGELNERLINEDTLLIQEYQTAVKTCISLRSHLISSNNKKLKTEFSTKNKNNPNGIDGFRVGSAALKLLDEVATTLKIKEPDTSLVCNLKRREDLPNRKIENSHAIGFQRVATKQGILYRFVDAETGEFEGLCRKSFLEFISQYFKILNFDNTYCDFELNIINLKKLDLFLNETRKFIKEKAVKSSPTPSQNTVSLGAQNKTALDTQSKPSSNKGDNRPLQQYKLKQAQHKSALLNRATPSHPTPGRPSANRSASNRTAPVRQNTFK